MWYSPVEIRRADPFAWPDHWFWIRTQPLLQDTVGKEHIILLFGWFRSGLGDSLEKWSGISLSRIHHFFVDKKRLYLHILEIRCSAFQNWKHVVVSVERDYRQSITHFWNCFRIVIHRWKSDVRSLSNQSNNERTTRNPWLERYILSMLMMHQCKNVSLKGQINPTQSVHVWLVFESVG